jgi:hypothetical protein
VASFAVLIRTVSSTGGAERRTLDEAPQQVLAGVLPVRVALVLREGRGSPLCLPKRLFPVFTSYRPPGLIWVLNLTQAWFAWSFRTRASFSMAAR